MMEPGFKPRLLASEAMMLPLCCVTSLFRSDLLHDFYVTFSFEDMIPSPRTRARTYNLSVPIMGTPRTFSV